MAQQAQSRFHQWEDLFNNPQYSTRTTRMNVDDINDMFGGGLGGFSDFFNAFFGGGRPRPQRRTTTNNARRTSQPQVYQQPVTISFLEAYNGTTRLLQFDNKKIEVKIPAGVKTGSKVRVSGAGSTAGERWSRRYIPPHHGCQG
jgi:curved DNA-binding protein